MKVIQNGLERLRKRCDGCKSILEFEYKDRKIKKIGDLTAEYITCPVCGNEITVRIMELEKI